MQVNDRFSVKDLIGAIGLAENSDAVNGRRRWNARRRAAATTSCCQVGRRRQCLRTGVMLLLVQLKTMWRDGTSHFLFEPIEFLEKLAALIPRPAVNLLVYHGVLAPRARWRSQVVRYGRPVPDALAPELEAQHRAAVPTHAWTWAALMHRVFALDVLACPRCGGRLRVIASTQDPAVVHAILAHLGLAAGSDSPGPAPTPPDHTAATG